MFPREFLKTVVSKFITMTGINNFFLNFGNERLNILTYHALCLPEDRSFRWISPAFVTTEQFESQMKFIRTRMNPISLSKAVRHLQEKKPFPRKSVVVTFDDGYANNLFYGEKILKNFKIPVTVFLATNYIDSNKFFHFDMHRCIKDFINSKRITDVNLIDQFNSLPDYKTCSVYHFSKEIQPLWEQCQAMLTDDHKRLLTPISSLQIREACSLFSWGAHTSSHAILSHLSEIERAYEINLSVNVIKNITGNDFIPFSYPNGTINDFSEFDERVLEDCGASCSVTTIPGKNSLSVPLYRLKRIRSISIGHTQEIFEMDISGINKIFQ